MVLADIVSGPEIIIESLVFVGVIVVIIAFIAWLLIKKIKKENVSESNK